MAVSCTIFFTYLISNKTATLKSGSEVTQDTN